MLPKPKFDTNFTPNVVNSNPLPSTQSWFQYNPNHSVNQQFVNNYQNYNTFGTNYVNPGVYGNNTQPSQPFLWYLNNYNQNPNPLNAFSPQLNQNYSQRSDYQNKRFKTNNNYNKNQFNCNNNNNNNHKKTLSCDPCSRWFPTQELYDKHISEHILCGLDECTLRAHPKVIECHQRMQHFCFKDKSMVKKFMALESEEDIQKWREERKRNYPTKDNIRHKHELREKQRLEVIEERKRLNELRALKEREEKERQRSDEGIDKQNQNFEKFKKNKNNDRKEWKLEDRQKPVANIPHRKLTLFQKLLLNDIQRNEHKIMETIELIVGNNFLDNI